MKTLKMIVGESLLEQTSGADEIMTHFQKASIKEIIKMRKKIQKEIKSVLSLFYLKASSEDLSQMKIMATDGNDIGCKKLIKKVIGNIGL